MQNTFWAHVKEFAKLKEPKQTDFLNAAFDVAIRIDAHVQKRCNLHLRKRLGFSGRTQVCANFAVVNGYTTQLQLTYKQKAKLNKLRQLANLQAI